MNQAVQQLENEANGKLKFIIAIEVFLALLALLFLYVEFRYLLKPLFDKLLKRNEDLAQTNKQLEKAIFMQSHTIREPLTSLMMLIQVIQTEKND